MDDWMTVDEAWWYTLNRKTPIKRVIVHSARQSNCRAWFVPDNENIYNGIDVRDEEGMADGCSVWYMYEVPREMAICAFKKYYEARFDLARGDVQYCEEMLKELECGNRIEDDAE